MKQSSTDNFTKLSNQLLQSTKFNFAEKVLLSWIIGWQESGKDCTASNTYVAEQLGITIKVLNKLITNLNKYSFFNSSKQTRQNQYGAWVNNKIMYVNVEELNEYILNGKEGCNPAPIEEPNPPIALTPLPTIDVIEEEMVCEVITDGIQDFTPKVVECINPTDTKELNPLKITKEDIEYYIIDECKGMDEKLFMHCYNMLMDYHIDRLMKELKDWNFITNFIKNVIYQYKNK
jgi:hypothetical protein